MSDKGCRAVFREFCVCTAGFLCASCRGLSEHALSRQTLLLLKQRKLKCFLKHSNSLYIATFTFPQYNIQRKIHKYAHTEILTHTYTHTHQRALALTHPQHLTVKDERVHQFPDLFTECHLPETYISFASYLCTY